MQCLKEGDIVIGKVAFKRQFGITVTLSMLEFGCNRDFTDLDIQVHANGSRKMSQINLYLHVHVQILRTPQ